MSAFTAEAARIERSTAVHCHKAVAILHYYVKGADQDGLEGAGFPVSGDMLAVEKRDTITRYKHRRRIAARTITREETHA